MEKQNFRLVQPSGRELWEIVEMRNRKLRIGFVGCGGIAREKHLPALKKMYDKCEVYGFFDVDQERASQLARSVDSVNARVYPTYEELLDDDSIDVVHIMTPNVFHCSQTVAAFEAGKHVMCEKPMASSSIDAQTMLKAYQDSGKKFTIAYQSRFRPEVQSMYRSISRGELGKIYFAKAHAIRRRGVPTWGVFANKALQGGGPLIDIGTHALDMTLWLMNNYQPVSAVGSMFYELGNLPSSVEGNVFGAWDTTTFEVEDSAFGMVKMADGATIFLEASWALNVCESREASTTLCGTLGGVEYYAGMSYEKDILVYSHARHGQLMEERSVSGGTLGYYDGVSIDPGFAQMEQWINCILRDEEPLVAPEQAFVVTKILEGIQLSAESGYEYRFHPMEQE